MALKKEDLIQLKQTSINKLKQTQNLQNLKPGFVTWRHADRLSIVLQLGKDSSSKNYQTHTASIDKTCRPVDVYVACLSNAVTAVLRLRIHRRVPVRVIEDDRVGARQVDTEAAGARRQNEAEDARVGVEPFHQQLTLLHLQTS